MRPRCSSRWTRAFAQHEGLDVELIREVSWSNIRDKLNIGLFDAAHLIAPVAIASSLGLGHVKVPINAAFGLGVNGNAITVSPALNAALAAAAEQGKSIADPMVSARALARVVADRKQKGLDPLTFGMTFPFSTHNYHLRFWMAAGGVDPDEDVRLVVLPPPYMVESLQNNHVDAFCVGAPWNSVAVDLGIGYILHFVSELVAARRRRRCSACARNGPPRIRTSCSAHSCASAAPPISSRTRRNRDEVCRIAGGAEPHRRRGGRDPPDTRRQAEGRA